MNSIGIPVNSAVTGHVPSASADAADDVRCEVTLLGTVILAVTNSPTILTNLILVVTKGSVKSCKLAQLVSLVIVLALGCGSSLKADQALELRSSEYRITEALTVSITLLIILTQATTLSSVSAVTRQ